ncbi:MAG: SCO family protein [Pedobacter sp.]|uniref:SCO family protein n=1 Tax=Pedobacter sp. TaxID=1411316 RepID=UPI002809FCEE|nr:SCO family protein [Pedobacter sp.]MDQ8004640.1 SCO family protein [Pedobacter sp.]
MNASSNKKKISTILILAAILVMPGFLYYLLQDQGKNRYKPLAIFGPKQVASTFHSVRGKQVPDTIYHVVQDFKLVNQHGDSLTIDSWKGKVIVANLFYSNVNSGSATATFKAMQGFDKQYHKNQMLHLVSISIDAKDDVMALKAFAENWKAVCPKWNILGGDTSTINQLVKQSLLLDAVDQSTASERKFIYSNKIVLLDSKHRIRGFYDAASKEALSKLDDEIKVLIAEELRNIRDGR